LTHGASAGLEPPRPTIAATFPAYLRDATLNHPSRALFAPINCPPLTYATVCRWVASIAARLTDLGISPGSHVVVYHDDTVQAGVFYLACSVAGVVPAPLSPVFSEKYLRRTCDDLATKWVLTTPSVAGRVIGAGLEAMYFGVGPRHGLTGHTLPSGPEMSLDQALAKLSEASSQVESDSLFMIQPTSGSAGAPKLVRRTHRAFARYAEFVGGELEGISAEPRFLAVSTLTHAFGLHLFATVLKLGGEFVVPSALDTAVSLDEVRLLDPVILPLTPRVLRSLYQQAYDEGLTPRARIFGPSARALLIAGGKSDAELLRQVEATGIDVIEWYGSSEASLVALTPRGRRRDGYAGRIVDDTSVHIDLDGELLVRSPGLMLGYHADDELTHAALTDDRFYRTGDIGNVSSDGYLRIQGRKRDVFNTPEGSNIYPERIESIIEAFPAVDQVMLVGDQRPYLAAFIVIRPEVLAATHVAVAPMSADAIIEPSAAPELFASVALALRALNQALEPIERVREFVLLSKVFDANVYAATGPDKIRRDRVAFGNAYASPIARVFAE
jgi:long-chain acyl-CoA synthetase